MKKPQVEADETSSRERLQRIVGAELEIRSRLGRGAFADVFEAFDPALKRTVAVKVLRADIPMTSAMAGRFHREAELVAAIRHPNILHIHFIGEKAGVVYLVLDHVAGDTLEAQLANVKLFSFDEATRVISEIARALRAAHERGIIHSDVKPANIMLDGVERRVMLGDFGLARVLESGDGASTLIGGFIGTPLYTSPEQAAGDAADARSDIYSLGTVGYRLVTGRVPFEGASVASTLVQHITRPLIPIRTLRPECPEWLAATLEKCLAKSPEERWQSAQELLGALDEKEQGPAGLVERAAKPAVDWHEDVATFRRFMMLALGLAAAALIVEGVLLGNLVWSLLAVLVAATTGAQQYARLWMRGVPGAAVFGGGPARQSIIHSEFGRHAAAAVDARFNRTNIVRVFTGLSHIEQGRLRGWPLAADQLVGRIILLAKRLHSLDEQIGAERATLRSVTPTRLLDELIETRATMTADCDRHATELRNLRDTMTRIQRLDQQDVVRTLASVDALLRGAAN